MAITKVTSQEQFDELKTTHNKFVIYFTLLDAEDEHTKEILSAIYKEYETFTEQDTSNTHFAVLDLTDNEEVAKAAKVSALSSFFGYADGKKVTSTGQTKDIEDLKELMAELAEPEKILPTELKSQAEFDACLSENELVVVDFTATWCGPCVRIAPKYKALAKQQETSGQNLLKGDNLVKYTKVDSDTREVIESAKVSCYPTFQLYRKGEKVETLEGADEDALKLAIKKLINPEYVEVHYAVMADSKEAFDKILKEHKTVVVDFTATWCPPCRMIKPIFEELAEEHKDNKTIAFVKVDVDDNDETAAEYKVQSMPTFKFFVDGKEVHGFSGADVQQLKDKTAELAK